MFPAICAGFVRLDLASVRWRRAPPVSTAWLPSATWWSWGTAPIRSSACERAQVASRPPRGLRRRTQAAHRSRPSDGRGPRARAQHAAEPSLVRGAEEHPATSIAYVEVTVPPQRADRRVDVRQRPPAPQDRDEIDGIPCTSLARTLLDLAAILPRREVERACDEAEVQELFDLRRSRTSSLARSAAAAPRRCAGAGGASGSGRRSRAAASRSRPEAARPLRRPARRGQHAGLLPARRVRRRSTSSGAASA